MKVKSWYLPVLLVLGTLTVYYPTLFAPFNSLDDKMLVQHLINVKGFSLEHHFLPGGRGDYYRPLITLSYALDKYLWGLEESFMHLENILIHTLNALLVFLLARSLSRNLLLPSEWLPFVAAAVFAVHPLNTEAVNWITARTDLLAATAVLLSLLCLFRLHETGRSFWAYLGAISMGIGCLCKEPALFFLPGAILLIWSTRLSGKIQFRSLSWPVILRSSTAYIFVVIAYFGLRWVAFHSDRGIESTVRVAAEGMKSASMGQDAFALGPLLFVLCKAIGFYFKKFFMPLPLNFGIVRVSDIYFYFGMITIVIMLWMLWHRRLLSLLGLVSMILASSALLVVINPMAWTPVAERYMYIASGPFVLTVIFSLAIVTRKLSFDKVVPIFVVLLLSSAAYATVSRNLVWQDNLKLYEDTVSKSPHNISAKNELALALLAKGRDDEARAIFEQIRPPENQPTSLNRVTVFLEREEYQEAREFLLERLKYPGPYEIRILEYLIIVDTKFVEQSLTEEEKNRSYRAIIGWLKRLQEINYQPFHWYRLGRIYMRLGEKENAKKSFAKAAKLLPDGSPFKKPAAKLARKLSE